MQRHYSINTKSLILISLALVLSVPYVQALSGCQRCANTGQCSAAYHNSPGQFCGFFHESGFISKPCCCPLGTICNLSAFECLCHVPNKPYYDDYGYGYQAGDAAGGVIFFLIIMCLCVCCCTSCWSDDAQRDNYDSLGGDFIPVAVPASEIPYGSINNPPPTAPLLPSQDRGSRSRSGGGLGGLGPALGGFAVGGMLGRALGGGRRRDNSRHGHGHGNHHHGRRGFGGGGYDIRGDTGGGGGGGHRGGGGGGFDIRGDS